MRKGFMQHGNDASHAAKNHKVLAALKVGPRDSRSC